jgi:hypothetical protein
VEDDEKTEKAASRWGRQIDAWLAWNKIRMSEPVLNLKEMYPTDLTETQ